MIRLQNCFEPIVNLQLCALHASSHYSKRWPFSASVNRISMRQFSVTLFIIHPPKKTRQLKLLLIAQRAVKKDVSILEFQDIPILSTKGQLNSELIYEVIVSPKMQTKNYKDFSLTKQTRILAKKTA